MHSTFSITLDDDPLIAPIIQAATGIETIPFATATKLMEWEENGTPSVVFVDIHLSSDECGLDVIPNLRARWPLCPIIVISGDKQDEAIGQALASGANDFVRKPLNRAEVAARVQARLYEMSAFAALDVIPIGSVSLYRRYRTLEMGAVKRSLSVTQMLLLETLALAKGSVVSRDEIKRKVWGKAVVTDNALDRKLFELRSLLKDFGDAIRIRARYGVGISLEYTMDFDSRLKKAQ